MNIVLISIGALYTATYMLYCDYKEYKKEEEKKNKIYEESFPTKKEAA